MLLHTGVMHVGFKFLFAVFVSGAVMATAGQAKDTIIGPVEAELIRVVDGDTLDMRVHIWLGQNIQTLVRLRGIDSPEIRTAKCDEERQQGQAARHYLEYIIADKPLGLMDVHYGKYAGRVVAQVILPDGRDLSDLLVKAGHAYEGEDVPETHWCAKPDGIL